MNAHVPQSSEKRLFTSEELADLPRTTADRALTALLGGDPSAALEICRRASRNEHEPIRDVYMVWSAQTQSYVYRRLGLEALRQMLHHSVRPWLAPLAEQFRNGVTKEALSTLARLVRLECVETPVVTECDDRFTFTLKGWGDQRLTKMGLYQQDSDLPLTIVSQADPLTGGREDCHVYRTVSFVAERLMVDLLGYPAFVLDEGAGDADLLTVFKNPIAIDDVYYERIGAVRDPIKVAASCNVAGGRLFIDEELAQLGMSCLERAAQAIERGELKSAEGMCRLAQYEWFPGHHLLRDWMTGQLSWIDANHPEIMLDYFEQAYERSTLAPMQEAVRKMTLRDVVPWFTTVFRQHAMSFHVEEDDEKITLATHPCGSGGRLIAEGAYEHRTGLEHIREASRATFRLENFPSYCLHCPITNFTLLEGDGPLYQIVDPGIKDGRLTGHCKFYLYKGSATPPQRLYDQVGVINAHNSPGEKAEAGETTAREQLGSRHA